MHLNETLAGLGHKARLCEAFKDATEEAGRLLGNSHTFVGFIDSLFSVLFD